MLESYPPYIVSTIIFFLISLIHALGDTTVTWLWAGSSMDNATTSCHCDAPNPMPLFINTVCHTILSSYFHQLVLHASTKPFTSPVMSFIYLYSLYPHSMLIPKDLNFIFCLAIRGKKISSFVLQEI